ncbi:unnamed protein product, partial [Hymenolepis diminuta]
MVGKAQLASLRKDLHTLAQATIHSDDFVFEADISTLAQRCFARDSPLICQREFCRVVITCSFKWANPFNMEAIISLINGSLQSLTFYDKFGVECPSRTDRIPLVLFGGMVEVPFSTNEALITLFPTFESFLSACNPDNLLESIDILNFYVKERIISPKHYKISDKEVDLLKTACRLLLPHWDTDYSRVLEAVLVFFGHIFNLVFTS